MKIQLPTILSLLLGFTACHSKETSHTITFATSAIYPPFEYKKENILQGFDIELGNLIAQKLGKTAVFLDLPFSTILPALQNGQADAAISTITVTQERAKHFDFSFPYYHASLAILFKTSRPLLAQDLQNKKIACQLGSSMELWLKKNSFATHITAFDNTNQAVEALKSGHMDAVLADGAQAYVYSQKNAGLKFEIIAQSSDGYGIALPKKSPYLKPINQALRELQKEGTLLQLQKKWLGEGI